MRMLLLRPAAGPAAPAAVPGAAHPAPRPQHRLWLIAIVVALAALVVGGSVQHAVDQRHAAPALYGIQVLWTASRFLDLEYLWRPSPKSAVKPDLALAGIRTTVG